MPDTSISALPAAGVLTGDEVVPVVQGGSTRRSTIGAVRGGGTASSGTGRNALTGWYHADGNGVTPGNSAATNTANLQTLLNNVPTAFGNNAGKIGGTVFFPEGRYQFSGQVTVPKAVRLLGNAGGRVGTEGTSDAVGTAFICATSGMTLLILNDSATGANLVQVGPSVERINFYGQNSGYNCRFVYAPNVNRWTIRDCGFKWGSVGVEGDSRANSGVDGGDCSWWQVDNCTFVECAVGVKCTSASGLLTGGDFTDCGTGIDLYGTSAPMKVVGAKMDVSGANGIGIRCRAYNCIFVACYFEITTNGATGMVVGPDPDVSYSGNDNVISACGFYGRGSAPQAVGLKILANANRTREIGRAHV